MTQGLKPGICNNPGGGMGKLAEARFKRKGTYVSLSLWLIHVAVWQKPTQFCKAITLQTLYARQQKRHRCIEQSFGLCGRGRWWMIWENDIETCIISYKKQITSLGSMQDTGCSVLFYWVDPERWYGEGSGRGVQDWEHVYTRGGFKLMYGKTNTVL